MLFLYPTCLMIIYQLLTDIIRRFTRLPMPRHRSTTNSHTLQLMLLLVTTSKFLHFFFLASKSIYAILFPYNPDFSLLLKGSNNGDLLFAARLHGGLLHDNNNVLTNVRIVHLLGFRGLTRQFVNDKLIIRIEFSNLTFLKLIW